jgi:hypothetical protein
MTFQEALAVVEARLAIPFTRSPFRKIGPWTLAARWRRRRADVVNATFAEPLPLDAAACRKLAEAFYRIANELEK